MLATDMNEITHRRHFGKLLASRGMLDSNAAEIGVAEGQFALDILKWGVKHLYLVDVWESKWDVPGDASSPKEWHEKNLRDCVARVKPFSDRVTILRGLSHEMSAKVADISLGFAYIDACHNYLFVLSDLTHWWAKLKPGGIIGGHDYEAPEYGVKKAVGEFAAHHKLQIHLVPEDHAEDAGFWLEKPL